MNSPTAAEIRALRQSHSLTQTEAAQVIWSTLSTWQKYEAGTRNMPQLTWWALNERIKSYTKN